MGRGWGVVEARQNALEGFEAWGVVGVWWGVWWGCGGGSGSDGGVRAGKEEHDGFLTFQKSLPGMRRRPGFLKGTAVSEIPHSRPKQRSPQKSWPSSHAR